MLCCPGDSLLGSRLDVCFARRPWQGSWSFNTWDQGPFDRPGGCNWRWSSATGCLVESLWGPGDPSRHPTNRPTGPLCADQPCSSKWHESGIGGNSPAQRSWSIVHAPVSCFFGETSLNNPIDLNSSCCINNIGVLGLS